MKTNNLRILAVEDNPADFRILDEHLKDGNLRNFEVVQAKTLKEALQLLPSGRFSVVLLDLNLPDSNGLGSLERIIEMRPMPPVIVLTGLDSEETGLMALSKNAQDYLIKGKFDGDRLIRSIRYAIERNRADEAVRRLNAELEERAAELQRTNQILDSARRDAIRLKDEAVEARRQAISDRKRLEAVMDALPVGVAIIDEKGGVIRANKGFEEVWGKPIPQARDISDYAAYKARRLDTGRPVEPEEWAAAIAVSTGKSVVDQTLDIERFDGTHAFVLNSAAPIFNAEGKLDGCAVAIQDITRLMESEQALRESKERFEILAEIAGELLRAREPQKHVESLCRKVMEHLDCQAFFNFMVDERAERLRLNACAGIADEEIMKIQWLDYGIAVCGCAARDRCRIVAEHIPSTPDVRTELVKSYGIKAYACHPMLDETGEVIGTLSFGTRTRETFSSEDLAMMKAVADQVAVAMMRMRNEQSVRESEERYRSLMELSPGAIYVNRGGCVAMLNTAAQTLFGAQSREQMLGKKIYDLYHPDFHAIIEDRMGRLLAGEAVPMIEEKIVQLDGTIRDVEVSSATMIDSEGLAIQVVLRDITERKQMEDELRETRDYLDNLINYANAPIIVWDPSYRITRFNRAFERLTGFEAGNVLGKKLDMLFPDASRSTAMTLIRSAISGEYLRTVEIPILQKSGDIRTVLWNSANIHGKDGAVVSTIAQGQDITERKVTEEMLKWELSVNSALATLSETLISQDYTIKEISGKVLDSARLITGSSDGYAGIVETNKGDLPDITIYSANESKCEIAVTDTKLVFSANPDGSYGGLWGHSLNTREPFFDNDPAMHPATKGTPPGHISMNSFLSAPAVLGDVLVGQIALANAPRGYEKRHLEAVKRMADLFAFAIQRINYENALEEANRSLEKRVLERSMKLYQINDKLITEIDERMKIEEDLRKSEFKFRTVADFTYAGEYWVDALGNYLYVSPSVERLTGYRRDEFMADKDLLAKIVYHEDSGIYEDHMHKEFNDLEPKELDFRIIRKDGAVRDIAHVCNPVFDESGEFIGRRASNRDVTEQRQAEMKLREGQEVANALINTSTEPVLLIGDDGTIIDANDEFSRRMNTKKGALAGILMYDVIDPDVARIRREKINRTKELGTAQRYEEKSGDSWYDTIIYPIRDDNGLIDKMAIFSRDITETRRLRQEIMEISELERKRLGQHLHDSLGQKLTGMAFLAESLHQIMMQKSYPEQANMEEIVTMAMDSVTQARNISKDLWSMRMETHDTVQVINDVADETRSLYKIRCDLHTALSEPVNSSVVASNLYFIAKESIINAIKHGNADSIDMRFYDDDECVYLEIENDGKGPKKEFMNTPGIGLRIMQYRAEILGGTLCAVPLKKGFRVLATMKKEFIKNYLR